MIWDPMDLIPSRFLVTHGLVQWVHFHRMATVFSTWQEIQANGVGTGLGHTQGVATRTGRHPAAGFVFCEVAEEMRDLVGALIVPCPQGLLMPWPEWHSVVCELTDQLLNFA